MTSVRQPADTDDQITLTVRVVEGATVIAVGGEVDMLTSPQLRTAVLTEFTPRAAVLVLDLEHITFLGTSGLAVLIELRDAAQAAGCALRLVCTSRRVLRPLTIAGLVPLFEVRDTVDEALAG